MRAPNEELPDTGTPQQRGCEMQMQMGHIILVIIGGAGDGNGSMMHTHGVCERAFEQVIVSLRYP